MSDCIEWAGAKSKDGYGQKRMGGKVQYMHRLAFEERHGRKPVGVVRHTCDNRLCYNADHLIEGTRADNSRDMVERGRSLKGERNPRTTLTAKDVLEIRRLYSSGVPARDVGSMYGISRQSVNDLVARRSWSHV